MAGDPDAPSTRGHRELVRLLQRALAVAKRRRRYRLGLALIALAALTTFAVFGLTLITKG